MSANKNISWLKCCTADNSIKHQAQIDLTQKPQTITILPAQSNPHLQKYTNSNSKPYFRILSQNATVKQIQILPQINPYPYPTFSYTNVEINKTAQFGNKQVIGSLQQIHLQQTRVTKYQTSHKNIQSESNIKRQIATAQSIKYQADNSRFINNNTNGQILFNQSFGTQVKIVKNQVNGNFGSILDQLTRLLQLQSEQLNKLKKMVNQAQRNTGKIQ